MIYLMMRDFRSGTTRGTMDVRAYLDQGVEFLLQASHPLVTIPRARFHVQQRDFPNSRFGAVVQWDVRRGLFFLRHSDRKVGGGTGG
jgi:hypothetical protein